MTGLGWRWRNRPCLGNGQAARSQRRGHVRLHRPVAAHGSRPGAGRELGRQRNRRCALSSRSRQREQPGRSGRRDCWPPRRLRCPRLRARTTVDLDAVGYGRAAVEAICRRLEGVPLAAELAAAGSADFTQRRAADSLLRVLAQDPSRSAMRSRRKVCVPIIRNACRCNGSKAVVSSASADTSFTTSGSTAR